MSAHRHGNIARDDTPRGIRNDPPEAVADPRRALLADPGGTIMAIGPTGVVLDVNEVGERITGYSRDELVGRELGRLAAPHPRGAPRTDDRRASAPASDAGSFEIVAKDGTLVRVAVGARLVHEGDAERAPGGGEEEGLEARVRQAERLEALGQLAGGISHDFNNVLMAIRGYSEAALAELPDVDDRLRGHVEEIRQAAGRAMGLVAQLLAFSRKRVREPGPTDLNVVVSNIATLLRRVIGDDIELRLELGEDLGYVEVDASQAEQAIVNLAVNARDAMPLGGRLTIRTANVVLAERRRTETGELEAGRYIELSVSDTGSGIDAATRAHLFEPFFTTKEIGKGTGLGLSTVYGFVYQASGQISVRSAPEHGATFTLHLPQVEAAPPLEPAAPPSPASPGSETIVLIEDDEALLRLLGTILESNGYTVLYAVDGPEAIEMLDRHAGTVDLVLTDVVMPRLTGYQVAERLRSRYSEVRFIFMSGYVERREDLDGGDIAAVFLEKPFTTDDLLTAIRQLLDRSAVA